MPLHEETTSTCMETINCQHKTDSMDHTYSLTDIWNITFLQQRVQNSKFCKTDILKKNHYRMQISYIHVPVIMGDGW